MVDLVMTPEGNNLKEVLQSGNYAESVWKFFEISKNAIKPFAEAHGRAQTEEEINNIKLMARASRQKLADDLIGLADKYPEEVISIYEVLGNSSGDTLTVPSYRELVTAFENRPLSQQLPFLEAMARNAKYDHPLDIGKRDDSATMSSADWRRLEELALVTPRSNAAGWMQRRLQKTVREHNCGFNRPDLSSAMRKFVNDNLTLEHFVEINPKYVTNDLLKRVIDNGWGHYAANKIHEVMLLNAEKIAARDNGEYAYKDKTFEQRYKEAFMKVMGVSDYEKVKDNHLLKEGLTAIGQRAILDGKSDSISVETINRVLENDKSGEYLKHLNPEQLRDSRIQTQNNAMKHLLSLSLRDLSSYEIMTVVDDNHLSLAEKKDLIAKWQKEGDEIRPEVEARQKAVAQYKVYKAEYEKSSQTKNVQRSKYKDLERLQQAYKEVAEQLHPKGKPEEDFLTKKAMSKTLEGLATGERNDVYMHSVKDGWSLVVGPQEKLRREKRNHAIAAFNRVVREIQDSGSLKGLEGSLLSSETLQKVKMDSDRADDIAQKDWSKLKDYEESSGLKVGYSVQETTWQEDRLKNLETLQKLVAEKEAALKEKAVHSVAPAKESTFKDAHDFDNAERAAVRAENAAHNRDWLAEKAKIIESAEEKPSVRDVYDTMRNKQRQEGWLDVEKETEMPFKEAVIQEAPAKPEPVKEAEVRAPEPEVKTVEEKAPEVKVEQPKEEVKAAEPVKEPEAKPAVKAPEEKKVYPLPENLSSKNESIQKAIDMVKSGQYKTAEEMTADKENFGKLPKYAQQAAKMLYASAHNSTEWDTQAKKDKYAKFVVQKAEKTALDIKRGLVKTSTSIVKKTTVSKEAMMNRAAAQSR